MPKTSAEELNEYNNWIAKEKVERLWKFLENNFLDAAMDLLNQEDIGWSIIGESYSQRSNTALHIWASRDSHESDRKFLSTWVDKFKDVTGTQPFDAARDLARAEHLKRANKIASLALPNSYTREFNEKCYNNIPPIAIAANSNQWGKVDLLTEFGAEWNNAHKEVFSYYFKGTSASEFERRIAPLIKRQDAPNWINNPVVNARTPLCSAIMVWDQLSIDAFIGIGADINARMKNGNTVLHSIMGVGGPDKYKALVNRVIKMGADISIKNDEGKTAVDCLFSRYSMSKLTPKEMSEEEKKWLSLQFTKPPEPTDKKTASQSAL